MAASAPGRASRPTKAELTAEKDAAAATSLRVHSPEAVLPRGRVLENWSICTKPHTGVKGGGCRNGLMGFFVRTAGGSLKRVVWVGRKGSGEAGVCDWVGDEGEEGDKKGELQEVQEDGVKEG